MSTLIPYMTDRLKAADWFHAGRWPEERISCPFCGATDDDIVPLGREENGLHRYSCRRCAQAKGHMTVRKSSCHSRRRKGRTGGQQSNSTL